MNLFRSEEHIKNWKGYKPGTEGGIVPLKDLVGLFSLDFMRRRLDADYVSRSGEYVKGFLSAVAEVAKKVPSGQWNPRRKEIKGAGTAPVISFRNDHWETFSKACH
jgi:hypothetical protein